MVESEYDKQANNDLASLNLDLTSFPAIYTDNKGLKLCRLHDSLWCGNFELKMIGVV
jgi:hypothetical protein